MLNFSWAWKKFYNLEASSLNFHYNMIRWNIFSLAVFEETVDWYCHSLMVVVGVVVMQKNFDIF